MASMVKSYTPSLPHNHNNNLECNSSTNNTVTTSTSTSTSTSSTTTTLPIRKSISTCKHIDQYKLDGGSKRYEIIEQYILSRKGLYSTETFPTPYCMKCNCFNGRLHVCLFCVHVSCWKSSHIQQHFKESLESNNNNKTTKDNIKIEPNTNNTTNNNNSTTITDKSHFLAVDLNLNQIYCHHCQDYIYDKEFDEIKESVKLNVTINLQDAKNPSSKRVKYRVWKPSDEESKFIKKNSENLDPTLTNPVIGLRGLNNLGNTCFMNSILQSFLHNPLLRNYFLSDMHKCEKKSNVNNNINNNNINSNNGSNGNSENEDNEVSVITTTTTTTSTSTSTNNSIGTTNGIKICLGCEMDKLFTCVFSGLKFPFTPHHFLYSCWNYSSYFVGCEQQDAHEFFISSLNGIHQHCGGTTGKDCDCIVHCTFGGSLKSQVSCLHCQFTSATSDPFIDISLDIPKTSKDKQTKASIAAALAAATAAQAQAQAASSQDDEISLDGSECNGLENGSLSLSPSNSISNKQQTATTTTQTTTAQPQQPLTQQQLNNYTLLACLERFTQPEKLDDNYFCRNCNCKQESTKQLSFDTLPVVICFHLKRFEQSKTSRRTHKIDTFIEFPTSIDMGPYTTIMKKKKQLIKIENGKKRKACDLENNNDNTTINDGNNNNDNSNNILNELNDQDKFPSTIPSGEEGDNSFIYELFAVVNHTGKIDNGHYTSFVKHQDSWYKCDDSVITSTSIHDVLKSRGYLLYYLKKQLEYTKTITHTKRNE